MSQGCWQAQIQGHTREVEVSLVDSPGRNKDQKGGCCRFEGEKPSAHACEGGQKGPTSSPGHHEIPCKVKGTGADLGGREGRTEVGSTSQSQNVRLEKKINNKGRPDLARSSGG